MIDVTDEDGLRVVSLARPEKRNALTREGLKSLEAAVEETDADVVYLTGQGPAFCAGADLNFVKGLDEDGARELSALGQRVFRTIEERDSVVVAGVDGPAHGGGLELAVACDLRVATERATFAASGVNIGIIGAWGGTYRLPELLGMASALDLELTGRTVEAQEALSIGLVSQVVDDPKTIAQDLAAKNSRSLQIIKRRVRSGGSQREKEAAEQDALSELIDNVL